MAFVELEDGAWINSYFVKEIFKLNPSNTIWEVGLNHGEVDDITDADRIRILKTTGFVRIKNEKDNE